LHTKEIELELAIQIELEDQNKKSTFAQKLEQNLRSSFDELSRYIQKSLGPKLKERIT
jgi:protein associated with RNAse G/E